MKKPADRPTFIAKDASGNRTLVGAGRLEIPEADWHAAALLLPHDGLVRLRAQRKSADEIATHYGVSKSITEWRLRMTGVDIQMRRSALR